jgi:hypothetical protein
MSPAHEKSRCLVGNGLRDQRADVRASACGDGRTSCRGEATHRFDRMLQKPMLMIEKQMDQQRYLFEEAHKQKDFLERLFGELFEKQRHELLRFLDDQSRRLHESLEMQRHFQKEVSERFDHFEADVASRLSAIEKHIHGLSVLPNLTPETTPEKKEGSLCG